MHLTEEYIKLPQEERQQHLDLSEACLYRGGNSTCHKGVLAQFLNTDIAKRGVDICHACHDGDCSNPRHLYWGTRKENVQDAIEDGKHVGIWHSTVKKYGYEEACKMNQRGDKAKGGHAGKGKVLTEEHKEKIRQGVLKNYAGMAESGRRN